MNTDLFSGMGALLSVLFVAYWYLIFLLVDNILENPRVKKRYWPIFGVLNTAIVFFLSLHAGNSILAYLVMLALMLIEFTVLYKDKPVVILFCASACIIHVLTIIAITMGTFSILTGYSIYELSTDFFWVLLVTIVAFILLNIAILCVLRFMPLGQIKKMNRYKERPWFIIAWMIVNNIYLLFNATLFALPQHHSNFAVNQVVSSLSILTGLYIVLFFAVKMGTLLEYKEKNMALEQAVYHEKQYRNSVIKDAIISYEINITKDLIVKGFEENQKELEEMSHCYSDMLTFLASHMIYCEDVAEFIRYASLPNIMIEYESGKSETAIEYRRLLNHNQSGDYLWVRATTNFLKEKETGDIIGFTYIKNIDVEKRHQLDLQRKAERDPLTGLYNKVITGELIDAYLLSQNNTNSALFMIDVDNFKEINNHLGHVYGDAVLSELADRLKHLFRSDDIIGRIGGDEYIAFLKGGVVCKKAKEKAEEICKAFHLTYKGQNGEEYSISGSVGISFFPQDGTTFDELYNHADIALYSAKNDGKHTFRVYNGGSFSGYKSNRTEIQTIGNISQKGFRENRVEYIFKILYYSENPVAAIHSALELVASHFSFERGYIFETSKDGKTSSNTFEWCAEGVTHEIDKLQNIPIEVVATAHASFEKTGIFILRSLDELSPLEQSVLKPQGIKSMFQFGIFDKSRLLGFIGFDNCRREVVPSDTDVDEMATICNILATFFVKQRADEDASVNNSLLLREIMNNLDTYTYVINRHTFEVLFMNEKAQLHMGTGDTRKICYRAFRGRDRQCSD